MKYISSNPPQQQQQQQPWMPLGRKWNPSRMRRISSIPSSTSSRRPRKSPTGYTIYHQNIFQADKLSLKNILQFFLLTISSAGTHRTKPTTKKDVYITMHSELRLPIKRPTEMHANYYPTHEVWLPTELCTSNLSHTRTLKVEGLSHMSTTVQRASWRFATPFN